VDDKEVLTPLPLHSYYSDINGYGDIGDLLDKEKDLDAIFVATPDHWHARHTIAGLKAGKHVYCEKMMARTADEGRQMVLTARETGKLLQIGHQRRSNPNYRFAYNILLNKYKFLGRITNANAQWNRGVRQSQDISLSRGLARLITKDILKRSEIDNPHEFRNWRWFKKYSNGPISDLGAHQIDIFNWIFGRPKSVIAAGGNDYYSTARTATGEPYKPREWYDNVMCIFDYENIPGLPAGEVARAYYQVLTTTSSGGGYFENFVGDRGSLKISETAANIKAFAEEDGKPYFDFLVSQGALSRSTTPAAAAPSDGIADARASAPPEGFDLTSRLGQKYIHQFHIENFFRAIRGEAKLNCDGEHAFQSEAPIFRINEAVEAQKRLFYTDDDFALIPSKKDAPAGAVAPEKKPETTQKNAA
jgi:predicted dehydrogenase